MSMKLALCMHVIRKEEVIPGPTVGIPIPVYVFNILLLGSYHQQ